MNKRFGKPPRADKRYTPRPGAYAILLRAGQLLVTHQSAPTSELQLPGGGIDPGESPTTALYREVREETGWSIGKPRRLGCFRRFTFMPEYELWAEKICHIYLAEPARQISAPSEPFHSALWLPIDIAIEELGVEGDRYFLRQLMRSRGAFRLP